MSVHNESVIVTENESKSVGVTLSRDKLVRATMTTTDVAWLQSMTHSSTKVNVKCNCDRVKLL
jgi:hypothetical protein